MGTFHDNMGDLHGITVVVDTTGPQVIVGRCHEANDQHVLLHDADVHEEVAGGVSKQEYVKRAAKWGVFAKHKTLRLDPKQVASITPLNQM
jgi:hypothetical protein